MKTRLAIGESGPRRDVVDAGDAGGINTVAVRSDRHQAVRLAAVEHIHYRSADGRAALPDPDGAVRDERICGEKAYRRTDEVYGSVGDGKNICPTAGRSVAGSAGVLLEVAADLRQLAPASDE